MKDNVLCRASCPYLGDSRPLRAVLLCFDDLPPGGGIVLHGGLSDVCPTESLCSWMRSIWGLEFQPSVAADCAVDLSADKAGWVLSLGLNSFLGPVAAVSLNFCFFAVLLAGVNPALSGSPNVCLFADWSCGRIPLTILSGGILMAGGHVSVRHQEGTTFLTFTGVSSRCCWLTIRI